MKNTESNTCLSESTLDNLLEGFQLISREWKYLFVNHAVVQQSKCNSKEDLLGFTMMEKFPGIERTELFKALEKCMTLRVAAEMENQFTFPDKSIGWFELRIEPVPEGIFILSIDITRRKLAEKDTIRYIEGLEKILELTSSKIREPLTSIMSAANLLETVPQSQEDLKKLSGFMKGCADSLDSLLKQLTYYLTDINTGKKRS